jgi:ABC-type sulfate/molybdate transport systems ATPase subunit
MTAIDLQVGLRRGDFQLALRCNIPAEGVTALLGPSGSGKSTVLRMIAGLQRPQDGRIVYGGRVWFDGARGVHVPTQRRRIGFVFQDYALFGHLTVAENVAYGLPRAQRRQTVARWLQRLHLAGYADRYPDHLSGGQRQRVALARALAPQPEVLLLDEPFSAVDATLRRHLRQELLETVTSMRRPVVLVSHDLDDARYLADRVGVVVDGRLLRWGPTAAVFTDPGCRAVAEVVGWSNFLPVRSMSGRRVAGAWGELDLEQEPTVDTAWVGIRPEHVQLAPATGAGLPAVIERITELGAVRSLQCRLRDDTVVYVQRPWDVPLPAPGEQVRLRLAPSHVRALPQAVSAQGRQATVSGDGCGVPPAADIDGVHDKDDYDHATVRLR